MVTIFIIDGLHPKAMQDTMRDRHYGDIEECMMGFLDLYQSGVQSIGILKSVGGGTKSDEKKPDERKTTRGPTASTTVEKTAAKAPAAGTVTTETEEKGAADWTASATCYRCGA